MFLTSSILAMLGFILNTNNIYCGVVNLIAFIFSLWIRWVWGPGDFSRVKLRGPFDVGFREVYCKKNGCAVSVYYPMDYNLPIERRSISLMRY